MDNINSIFLKFFIFIFIFIFPLTTFGSPVEFYVSNKTNFQLIELQISGDKSYWSAFGSVKLNSGETAVYEWNPAPQSNCKQFIRGKFLNQGWSTPFEVDFCISQKVQIDFGAQSSSI